MKQTYPFFHEYLVVDVGVPLFHSIHGHLFNRLHWQNRAAVAEAVAAVVAENVAATLVKQQKRGLNQIENSLRTLLGIP